MFKSFRTWFSLKKAVKYKSMDAQLLVGDSLHVYLAKGAQIHVKKGQVRLAFHLSNDEMFSTNCGRKIQLKDLFLNKWQIEKVLYQDNSELFGLYKKSQKINSHFDESFFYKSLFSGRKMNDLVSSLYVSNKHLINYIEQKINNNFYSLKNYCQKDSSGQIDYLLLFREVWLLIAIRDTYV